MFESCSDSRCKHGRHSMGTTLSTTDGLIDKLADFIWERSRAWYQDAGIATEIFLSVRAVNPVCPFDFDQRIKAVSSFVALPEAAAHHQCQQARFQHSQGKHGVFWRHSGPSS